MSEQTSSQGNHGTTDEARPVSVSIMVVSYNPREMTLECLRSLKEQSKDLDYAVLFIDNDSEDGSFEAVSEEFGDDPRFHRENLGFANANNVLYWRPAVSSCCS